MSSKHIRQVLLLPQSNAERIVRRRISKNLIFVASTTLATEARSRYIELNRLSTQSSK